MKTEAAKRSLKGWALYYARELGWAVFPLRGKKPLVNGGFHAASTDRGQIKKWWTKWPDANIGIACNSEHGPIVVDYDDPKANELPARECSHVAKLPATLKAQSGSGRLHRFYSAPRSGKTIKRTTRPFKDAQGHKYAVDVLGDGGYVVVTPSVHPETHKSYRWKNWGTALAPFPRSLEQALRAVDKGGDTTKVAPPLPEVIQEGERDTTLTSIAGTMRRRGVSPEAILEALRVENASGRVQPPLDDKQLRKIAKSSGTWAPVPIDLSEPITDVSLAERLAATQQHRLRYVPLRNKWLLWTESNGGGYWQLDDGHEVDRLIQRMVKDYLQQLAALNTGERDLLATRLKELRRYLFHRSLTNVRLQAQTQQVFETSVKSLDSNPYLFNVGNGTLELDSRRPRFRPARRDDLLTKHACVSYNAEATCPRWDVFLEEITGNDKDLINYLRRAVGYTLIGNTDEHVLFFLCGPGGGGKSTFLEVLGSLFDQYATTIHFDTLLHTRGGDGRGDIADLEGVRFVSANETPERSGRWNAARIKQLTGGDRLRARRLYEEPYEFEPTHTLWCRGNTKPGSHDQSDAFWERMKLIPFTQKFRNTKQEELNLKEHLLSEGAGILNWALRGLRDWHKNRLADPPSVRKATHEYQEDENVLGEFIKACCVRGKRQSVGSAELYRAFTSWWEEHPRSEIDSDVGNRLPQ